MKLDELKSEGFSEDELFEMVNIKPERTGLSIYIYVSPSQGSHGPRIKVSNTPNTSWSDDNFSVSISDAPEVVAGKSKLKKKDLELVFLFVRKNKEVLLRHWERKSDSEDVMSQISKVD